MTVFQKIVKYAAIVFAIYLSLMIIGAIIFGITAVCGLGMGIEILESGDNTTIINKWEQEYTHIRDMDIDIGVGKLTIRKGNSLKVEASDVSNQFICEAKGDKLEIKDKKTKGNFGDINNVSPEVIIYLPETLVLDEVDIEAGINDTHIEYLKANKVELNGGIGKIVLTSKILEKAEIKCGIGKLELNLIGLPEDYKIKTETGLGNLKVDGQTVSNHQVIGKGRAIIDIEAGMGETIVTFEEEGKL